MAEPSPHAPPTPALAIVADPAPEPRWHPLRRIVFRLSFAFFVLELLPFPFGYLPATDAVGDAFNRAEVALAAWVGRNLLGITRPIGVAVNRSGDRTVDYLFLLVVIALSAAIALVWSIADRRRGSYASLDRALRVVMRFALASNLLDYGFAKVFPTQMPNLLSRLIEPYGQSSPMGLRAFCDEEHRALGLTNRSGGFPGALRVAADPDGTLTLEGVLDTAVVRMRLARADLEKELLVSRGFHWVNEVPFNR